MSQTRCMALCAILGALVLASIAVSNTSRAEPTAADHEACQMEAVMLCRSDNPACLTEGFDRCDAFYGVALWPMRDNGLRGPSSRRRPASAPVQGLASDETAGGLN